MLFIIVKSKYLCSLCVLLLVDGSVLAVLKQKDATLEDDTLEDATLDATLEEIVESKISK